MKSKKIILALALSACSSLLTAEESLAAPAPCEGVSTALPTPRPGTQDNVPDAGFAATGPDNVWLAGRKASDLHSVIDYEPLVLRDTGDGWQEVSVPDSLLKGVPSFVHSISTTGPSDTWIGGSYYEATANEFMPFVFRWNGTQWLDVPFTVPGRFDGDNFDLAAASSNDVWVSGIYVVQVDGRDVARSFISRWDGEQWNRIEHPDFGFARQIVALSSTNVWVLGHNGLIHWDGGGWISIPAPSPSGDLGSLSIGPSGEVWLMGTSRDLRTDYNANGTYIARLGQSGWEQIPIPALGGRIIEPRIISVARNGTLWLGGNYYDFRTKEQLWQPFLARWDGSRWLTLPDPGNPVLYRMIALGALDVRMAGFENSQAGLAIQRLCTIRLTSTGFRPTSTTAREPGTSVYFYVKSVGDRRHKLVDVSGLNLFESPVLGRRDDFAFTYEGAGRFRVKDQADGSSLEVSMPIGMQLLSDKTCIYWAGPSLPYGNGPFSPGFAEDVQIIRPGSSSFGRFRKATNQSFACLGSGWARGTYKFRARLRNLNTGATSAWSETLTFTLS